MMYFQNDWDEILGDEFQKEYYQKLRAFLKTEYATKIIYPNMYDLFNALKYTPYAQTKVVILGQDPYINPGQAHGLSFSVQPTAKIPPSLRNIYKELETDLGCTMPRHGHLVKWTAQGVLLLNTVLTVEAGKSKSHANKGWEIFTNHVIEKINEKEQPVVFLLWGKDAASKAELVTNPHHKVLLAAHPSPLAGGRFFGCQHFSQANAFLTANQLAPIDWQIDPIA